jgi:hypothetical protein
MLCPFLTKKLVNLYILVCQNVNRPTLALKHAFNEKDFRRQITNAIPV